jgi:hypothetical protein
MIPALPVLPPAIGEGMNHMMQTREPLFGRVGRTEWLGFQPMATVEFPLAACEVRESFYVARRIFFDWKGVR